MVGACLPMVAAGRAAAGVASVPRPDHIVIVVEENHSSQNIIGNPNAPYINSLAASGASMTNFFAETHPSQPNYLAMFSGDTQGVTSDACPQSFSAPNLGSRLLGAGLSFAGYSETMPSAGYTGCSSGKYVRKHNPWSDFTNVPASANLPFTSFPSDYSQLPAVSYVMPNLDNDMHDGTIAQGDTWLHNNLDGYVTWAKTHNSVFVLTFDEDDFTSANRIPTIITGQGVQTGQYAETANHYNLLRTIEDAYGLAPVGASATASPILDIWSPPTGNQPPVAAFSVSCDGLVCAFDGSGSADPDVGGSVVSFAWSFGDGSSGSGVSVSHAYAVGGSVSVVLTVVDDQGASGSVSHSASPVAPVGAAFVSDSFARTVRGGWGSADVGGAWSTVGTAANVSVTSGAGLLALAKAGQQLEEFVGPARTDADVGVVWSADRVPVAGPVYVTVMGRRVAAGNGYSAKVIVNANRSVTLRLERYVGGSATVVAGPVTVAGLAYAAGMSLSVRVQVTGTAPTTVRARLWVTGQAEPSTWLVAGTDATASLQAAGQIGLIGYLSSAATNAPLTLTTTTVTARPTAN
jgi:phosphoesterase family protein/PKD domain-containing protein